MVSVSCQCSLIVTIMHLTLRLWICLAAAACVSATWMATEEEAEVESLEQCKGLDHLELIFYSLSSNSTVKILPRGWHLKSILSLNQSDPISCIRLEDGRPSRFSAVCDNEKNVYLENLFRPFKLQTSTTLPQDGPQQTETSKAWTAEAATMCGISCPVHHHDSAGVDMKKHVAEWQEESLYFYFRPGPSFRRLQYEVSCMTEQQEVFRREVEIVPGEEDAAKVWHLVELKERQNSDTIRLNGKLLRAISLPESCVSRKHFIWMIGDGLVGINCTLQGRKVLVVRCGKAPCQSHYEAKVTSAMSYDEAKKMLANPDCLFYC